MTDVFPRPGRAVRGSETGAPVMALFDLMGRRWAMGVLWQLCEGGPATFRELQARCGGVSPSVLNTRLKDLRVGGFITHGDTGYMATAMGMRLFGMLKPLGEWAHEWAREAPWRAEPGDAGEGP